MNTGMQVPENITDIENSANCLMRTLWEVGKLQVETKIILSYF